MNKAKLCAITTVSVTMKTFVVPMMDHLQKNGYDVTLLCSMDQVFIRQYQNLFKCVSVQMKRGIDPLGALRAIWKMYRLFRKERFDMIQYATPNAAFYAAIIGWLTRTPKRVYCQWGIRYVGCNGWERVIFRLMEKVTCSLSTDIRPASRKNLNFAVGENLYRAEKADVVGDGGTIGVDLKRFDISKKAKLRYETRTKLSFGNSVVFGYVGTVRPDKGCNELLAAFKSLWEKNNSFRLLILGEEFDQDPLNPNLRQWAVECDGVYFAGGVFDVPRYMAAMDILVHPSYREGFSMVIQEAAAFGLPVITTDIPGPSEVIEENVTGLLVPPKDTASLFGAMERLGEDTNLQKMMGEAGLERDIKLFERSIMLDKVLKDRNTILARIS